MLSIKDPAIAALVAVGEFGPRTFASTNTTLPTPELVDFDDDGVVGGLYRPSKSGPKSRIAVYVMHAERAYLSFSVCTSTQTRLHDFLCKQRCQQEQIQDTLFTSLNNKFFAQDTRYLAHTTHTWPLLHKNGITRQIVPSVRVPSKFDNLVQD
jgi:hypothetical protein